jgi:hypothetical protein
MTGASSAHVAATRTLTQATGGLDYRSTQISAGILYSY